MANDRALYKRLTSLFRSGPIVKRKIRADRVTRTRSSALDFFKKSQSHVYANAINAYGQYDRMARYADFSEMDYTPEISSALDIFCLAGDNVVPLLRGEKKTVKELFESGLKNFYVHSFDIDTNRFSTGLCKQVLKTGKDQEIFKIILNDDSKIRLTKEHKVLLSNGEYLKVKDLKSGYKIRSLYIKSSPTVVEETSCIVKEISPDGIEDVYDLEVDKYHNFAIGIGSENSWCIVHNSHEATATDDKGRVLHIHSDNKKINSLLEELFYDTLNVEFNLSSWVRNLPIRKGTLIPLLDGRNIPIEDIVGELSEGKNVWVYSIQSETNRFVPGKVTWCGLTQKDSKLTRVHLDDGSHVDTSPEHEFILRDGSSRKACDLKEDDRLMPFYRKISDGKEKRGRKKNIKGYELVYDPGINEFVHTHRRISEFLDHEAILNENDKYIVVHHKNFKKCDNSPENLQKTGNLTHISFHEEHGRRYLNDPLVIEKRKEGSRRWLKSDRHRELSREHLKVLQEQGLMKKSWDEYNQSPLHAEHNGIRRDYMNSIWIDSDKKKNRCEEFKVKFDDRCVQYFLDEIRKEGKYIHLVQLGKRLLDNTEFVEYFKALNPGKKKKGLHAFNSSSGIKHLLKNKLNMTYCQLIEKNLPEISSTKAFLSAKFRSEDPRFKSADRANNMRAHKNHSVVKVEFLSETDDVYCMNVLGQNGEHDRHNFMVLGAGTDDVSSGICLSNCKFGDFFSMLDVSPDMGVINVFPIPVNEIEREEGFDPKDPMATRFRWVTQGNRILENWQIAHYRLLGNDAFLPYGSSILDPARRIWRQLILIEDAMLVYRVVRSPERRVFYIDVGNIPPEDVPSFMEHAKSTLRSNQVIDRTTGRVDKRYNPLPVWHGTPIPLLDGRTLTIKELAKERDEGKENWVYSVQDKTHEIVPGKVVWCGLNYNAKKLVKIWLDDDTWCMTAPEHPFLMRDGTSKRADKLLVGDSLMPFYRKTNNRGYETIYNPATQKYESTHVQVAKNIYPDEWKDKKENSSSWVVVHHKEPWLGQKNRFNNTPKNLQVMDYYEHRKWHIDHLENTLLRPDNLARSKENIIRYNKSDAKRKRTTQLNIERNSVAAMKDYNGSALHKSHNANRKAAQNKLWSDPEQKSKRSAAMRWVITDEFFDRLCDTVKKNPSFGRNKINEILLKDKVLIERLREAQITKRKNKKISYCVWEPEIKRRGYNGLQGLRDNLVGYKNHKVKNVEFIDSTGEDVYCMTVVGQNNEDDRHNFAIKTLNIDNTSVYNGIIVINSTDEDYFLPTRGDSKTKIDTLAGGQYTGDIDDVKYIQSKLFAALKVPKAYLGYEEDLSCFVPETPVALLDGRTLTIEQIKGELDQGNKIWVYSLDEETKQIVPGEVELSRPTRPNAELVRVTLDNDASFDCTPDHKWMLRDGTWCEAGNLKQDDSLMPLHRRILGINSGRKGLTYEQVYDPATDKWLWTHRLVAERSLDGIRESLPVNDQGLVIHHSDFNRFNNSPDNLIRMGFNDHIHLHSTIFEKIKKDAQARGVYSGQNNGHAKRCRAFVKDLMSFDKLVKYCEENKPDSRKQVLKEYGLTSVQLQNLLSENGTTYPEFAEKYLGGYKLFRKGSTGVKLPNYDRKGSFSSWCKKNGYSLTVETKCNQCGKIITSDRRVPKCFCNKACKYLFRKGRLKTEKNNPIFVSENDLKIFEESKTVKFHKKLNQKIKTKCNYCGIEIDSLRYTPKRFCSVEHNMLFKKDKKFGDRRADVVYVNKFDEDLQRDIDSSHILNHKVKSVVKLDERRQTWCLSVKKWHNFALKDGTIAKNSKSSLAQVDIRFSRTINAIQRIILSEFNKIAVVHLYTNGFDDDDLINFNLQLSNPSTIAQQQKLELYKTKFDIANSMPENMLSRNYIRKNVLGLTDDQVKQIEREKEDEKKRDLELEAVELPTKAEPGGMGGMGDIGLGGFGEPGAETEEESGLEVGEAPPEGAEPETPEEAIFASTGGREGDLLISDDRPIRPKITRTRQSNAAKLRRAKSALPTGDHNRQRLRYDGMDGRELPTVLKLSDMVSPDDDPFDHKAVTGNPFNSEGVERDTESSMDGFFDRKIGEHARMDSRMTSLMRKLRSDIPIDGGDGVLTESDEHDLTVEDD